MEFSLAVPGELLKSKGNLSSYTPHVMQSKFSKRRNNQLNNTQSQGLGTNNTSNNQSYHFNSFNVFNDYTENDEILPYEQVSPDPITPGPSFEGLVAPPGPDGNINRSSYGAPVARRSPLVLWAPPSRPGENSYGFSEYGNGNSYGSYSDTSGSASGATHRVPGSGGLSAKTISDHQFSRWYYIATLRTFGYDYIRPPGIQKTLKTMLEEEEMSDVGEASLEGIADPTVMEGEQEGVEVEAREEDVMEADPQPDTTGDVEALDNPATGEDRTSGQPVTAEDDDLDAEIQEAEEFNYSDSEDEYDDSEYAGPLVVADNYQVEAYQGSQTPARQQTAVAPPHTVVRTVQRVQPGNQSFDDSRQEPGDQDSQHLSVGWNPNLSHSNTADYTDDSSAFVEANNTSNLSNISSIGHSSNLSTSSGSHLHTRLESMSFIEGSSRESESIEGPSREIETAGGFGMRILDSREGESSRGRPSLTLIPMLGPPVRHSSAYHDVSTPGAPRPHEQVRSRLSMTGTITPPPLFSIPAPSTTTFVNPNANTTARALFGGGNLMPPPPVAAAPSRRRSSGWGTGSRRSSGRFDSEYAVSNNTVPESPETPSRQIVEEAEYEDDKDKEQKAANRRYSRLFFPAHEASETRTSEAAPSSSGSGTVEPNLQDHQSSESEMSMDED